MDRKPIGIPRMPDGYAMSSCGRFMLTDKQANRGVVQRYLLAMKAVKLIASDRMAEAFAVPP